MSDQPKIYRIYSYDGVQRCVTNDLIKAASDEDAIAQMQAPAAGSKCEIWEGQRLVAQLEQPRLQA